MADSEICDIYFNGSQIIMEMAISLSLRIRFIITAPYRYPWVTDSSTIFFVIAPHIVGLSHAQHD